MICRFCGKDKETGINFDKWVKPTFTDHDKLIPGDIVCHDCLFWFDESNQELANILGKDKPQKMRNYSHFIVNAKWIPLSKKDKWKMVELLVGDNFPEMAVISESGQKHIVFRAKRNNKNSKSGWIQFEEKSLWLEPTELKFILDKIEKLMVAFSKTEIQLGEYKPYRIIDFGLKNWQSIENELKQIRNSLLFNLALFLAQRKEPNGKNSSKSIGNNLEGNTKRLQKQIPEKHLGTI